MLTPIRNNQVRYLTLLILCVSMQICQATDSLSCAVYDTLDIRIEVLVASEGEQFYSAMGHTALRIACPTYGTDYVFTYEMDDIQGWLWGMIKGTKKGRTCAVPTSQYVNDYSSEGRSVEAYSLNLPSKIKYRLWSQMDERLGHSPQRYDVRTGSCGAKVYRWIYAAMDVDSVQTEWSDVFNATKYEAGGNQITDPWYRFLLLSFMQGELQLPSNDNADKIHSPAYLLEALHGTTAYGHPLLSGQPRVLAPRTASRHALPITPLHISCGILLLALVNLWMRRRPVSIGLLAIFSLFGLLGLHAVLTGFYTGSEWNTLLVPFFPLLLPLWKWRKKWAPLMVIISILWVIIVLLSPVALALPPHIVLGVASILVYVEINLNTIK